MSYVYNSLRSEQSQIDTLLEVLEEYGYKPSSEDIENIKELYSFENLDSIDLSFDCDVDAVVSATHDRIMESVLEVLTITTKRILLGCGGPTRYIEIDFDANNDVVGGRYFDNAGAMNDRNVPVERELDCSEAEAFACRYGLSE